MPLVTESWHVPSVMTAYLPANILVPSAGLLARTLRWPLSGQGYTHAWLKWNHPEQSNLSSIPCLWSSEQGGMREVGIQADLLKEVTLLLL